MKLRYGEMVRDGKGLAADPERGRRLIEEACAANEPLARDALGRPRPGSPEPKK